MNLGTTLCDGTRKHEGGFGTLCSRDSTCGYLVDMNTFPFFVQLRNKTATISCQFASLYCPQGLVFKLHRRFFKGATSVCTLQANTQAHLNAKTVANNIYQSLSISWDRTHNCRLFSQHNLNIIL